MNEQIGPYTILAPLGAGGMGEVYRARDANLGRDVAIKILPPHLMADPDRRKRFTREARLLATLNHPNIGTIYGFEEADGITALVLELLEGPTLADRLARGSLPVSQTLTLARQIAEALAAAHEKGVVHRDLKPSNIILQTTSTSGDPRAKVLDFGLARTVSGDGDQSQALTVTSDATQQGSILGTPAYMSPEQARGEAVDARTDIWSFGCVLFEMLARQPPFEGRSVAETMARILEREPDWSVLPAETPASIRRVLERCLRKDPSRRLRDIADAVIEIDDATQPSPSTPAESTGSRWWRGRGFAWVVATAFAVALGTVSVLYLGARAVRAPPSPASREVVEFTIEPPPEVSSMGAFGISPDGRHIAFTAGGVLRIRSLDSREVRILPGTEGASAPFWKPDSQAIGFFASGFVKTVPLSGGTPLTICRGRGQGTWNRQDVIVFGGSANFLGGDALRRVSAAGAGTPTSITSLQGEEYAHGFPAFLPDGQEFLYLAQSSESNELRVGSLTSSQSITLGPFETNAQIAAGYLFSMRSGSLFAQPFDVNERRLKGSPSTIVPTVGVGLNHGNFSVSESGKLGYGLGPAEGRLTWFNREGESLGTVGEPGRYNNLALSRDERHLAVSRITQKPGARPTLDLWRIDLELGRATRLTDEWGWEWDSAWSPDGLRLAFNHAPKQGGLHSLFVRPADASGQNELLVGSGDVTAPDWSHDGEHIVYSHRENPSGPSDLLTISTKGDRNPSVFLKTLHSECCGSFSPDDRWIAYQSNASGRVEVYVRPFPPGQGEFMISRDGGWSPTWRGDGKELYFLARDGTLMAARFDPLKRFSGDIPRKLFPTPFGFSINNRQYVATKDGQRFMMTVNEPPTPIVVLLNWPARLKE